MMPLYWPLLLMIVKTPGLVGSLYRMLPATSKIEPAYAEMPQQAQACHF